MPFRSFEQSLIIPYAPDRKELDNPDFEVSNNLILISIFNVILCKYIIYNRVI